MWFVFQVSGSYILIFSSTVGYIVKIIYSNGHKKLSTQHHQSFVTLLFEKFSEEYVE